MEFDITRIETKLGIFRLSGSLAMNTREPSIAYDKVEFMGTDGWCELDTHSNAGQAVLNQIASEIIEHLS
ncbi:hypothetical protein MHO82_24980 [Vibrio sp. Of7-15]|uniref:hypothetical protein n=1 Tax=Vibrio sp. Of7-15 TaxID=2724879 RepID=UPI001EF2BCB1|nr:hypothetical protein [Vibrio sp. Of7-15]MCG7500121.1 hypothetical protein [Vibrio sp. Of7-15]